MLPPSPPGGMEGWREGGREGERDGERTEEEEEEGRTVTGERGRGGCTLKVVTFLQRVAVQMCYDITGTLSPLYPSYPDVGALWRNISLSCTAGINASA